MNTRIVIAVDHPLILKAISQILEDADGFDVVGVASTGAQVAPLVARTSPDLVLVDLQLSVLDGLDCIALLRERHPKVTVAVFSGEDDPRTIERVLSIGVTAYIAKSVDPTDIPALLRHALEGNVYFNPPSVDRAAVRRLALDNVERDVRGRTGLTQRELEILAAVSRGLSNRAVGDELFLSDHTVKFHLHRIYGKLGVANRTQATRVAHQLGVVGDLASAG
jgi:DNA-binding NarL/FixJ family response regulator